MKHINQLFLISLIIFAAIACKKEGCTDPKAYNYSAEADTDDGSCIFEGCTDPIAVNYDSNATISSICIYDQIGSWTSTSQEIAVTANATMFGITVFDTSFTDVVDPDSLDPSGLDFIAGGTLYVHYNDEPSDTGTWSQNNNDLTLNVADSTLMMTIDTINSSLLRLLFNGVETGTDQSSGVDYTVNYNGTFEFSRN